MSKNRGRKGADNAPGSQYSNGSVRRQDGRRQPAGEAAGLELADIIDCKTIQSLLGDFYKLACIPMSIVDLKGQLLVGVGWQDICTQFHRVHPETCKHCVESDKQLGVEISPGECRLYKCKNNMWDMVTPILVGDQHVGNVFAGQFFFQGEVVDRELFRSQAQRYGFDEERYLAALDAVPRLSREAVDTGMAFLRQLACMLSQLSYSNTQLVRSVEERNALTESLRGSWEHLNRVQEIAHLGSWELDLASGELTWSDEVYRIFGLPPQEFEATYEAFMEAVHPDDRAAVDAAYMDSIREGKSSYEIEHRVVRKGTGEIRWVHERCQHVRDADGKAVLSMGMVLDVTSRKLQEQCLRRVNRTLKVLGNNRRALIRATEEESYLEDACRIIVQDGGYAMVWIGAAEEDESKSVRPIASAGFEDGYLDTLGVTWADTERGRGPTGTAIRTGQAQLCENMLTDPAFSPWRQEAIKRGYAASIALPLLEGDRAFGVLTIYSREPSPFTEDDVRLLTELAGDLSFGIVSLRLRAAKAQAVVDLHRSEERFKLLSKTAGRLLTTENPQGVVDALCHEIMDHLNCQAFFNFLVDERAGRLRLNACAGIPQEEARRIEWLDYGVAVCGCVARDGVRLVAEDIPAHPDPRTDLVASYGIRAYACHPLVAEGRVLGTLSFGTRTRSQFSEDDLSLMKTVADQVAVAMQRLLAREAVCSVALFPEQNPSPVLRIARDGELLYANGPSADLLEFWACRPGQIVPDEIRQSVEQAFEAGEVIEMEVACGEVVYSFAIAPITSGQYANLYGRDVTERKRAEEEREHHLDLHVSLVQVARDILNAADVPTLLQRVADASLELIGARLGASGHGFIEGRPQVCAISRCDDAPSCQMVQDFSVVRGGVYMNLLREKESFCLTGEELKAHSAWRGLPEGHVPLRGLLGARLLDADSQPNGLVMVSDKIDGDFTEEDEVILRQLASITSLAIQLIDARDQAQQREREAIEASAALRDGAERLRLAMESGRMGRWEWDMQADVSFWDPRMYELLGVDIERPASCDLLLELVDKRDREAFQRILELAAASGDDYQTEFRIVRAGGEIVWLTLCGKAILDDSGRGSRMFGVLYDITLRRQMEEQLRLLNDELEEEVQAQTEELRDTIDRLQDEVARRVGAESKLYNRSQMLEGFFQHTITPLAFMDRDFNFIRVNEAYAAAGGRTPDYFAGRNHFTLYPQDENREVFEQVVQTKQPYRAYAKPFNWSDRPQRGATFWNWQLTPLLDGQGEVQFLVLNLEDVTQRQRAFQELERRARQLQELTLELSQAEDRERRRLAEILHDDLQQQLAAAKFHLGILGGRLKQDPSARNMVGQLDQILKDAIEKSRSLSHELSPAVLYHSKLGEIFEWLARQVQMKHGLTVHIDAEEQVQLPSEALKTFLYKAAQEILFNIVKHARVREAQLRLKHMRGKLWLTIADRGQGFNPTAVERTGGFGLFSIRERIGLLGGRMKVRSVKGRGSIFVIALPDGNEAGAPAMAIGLTAPLIGDRAAAPIDSPAAGGSCLRIVLADDHKVMREGLATLLNEQADMNVIGQAGNGREVVNLTCELQPDVVIMDVAMPLMAGDEATRQIKLHMPKTRVIALSMFEEPGVVQAIRKAGAERYLLKTAPLDELLAAIRAQTS